MKPAQPATHPVVVAPLAKAPDQDTDRTCDPLLTSRLLVHTACYRISIRAQLSSIGISPEAPTVTVQWTHPTQVNSGSGDGAGGVWLDR
jgi:hypothetical protein